MQDADILLDKLLPMQQALLDMKKFNFYLMIKIKLDCCSNSEFFKLDFYSSIIGLIINSFFLHFNIMLQ
jgi:hypothetical protein